MSMRNNSCARRLCKGCTRIKQLSSCREIILNSQVYIRGGNVSFKGPLPLSPTAARITSNSSSARLISCPITRDGGRNGPHAAAPEPPAAKSCRRHFVSGAVHDSIEGVAHGLEWKAAHGN